MQLINAAQSKLTDSQIEERERLAAMESQILKNREAAIAEFQEAQLQLFEREQHKVTQQIEVIELERSKQLQQALNDGLIRQTDIEIAKLDNTRERVKEELRLELEKLDFLSAQPAFNDPRKEEERQSKIRESQKRTAQLQLQLLEQQRQAQELLYRKISERIDAEFGQLQNLATDSQQRLEIELKQQDYLTKSLDNQNRILQARQGLQSALGQFIETEFKIMEAGATTEKERDRVARMQVNYKLQALYTEQATQREMLEIDLKRNEIAQERAEIENRVAQIKSTADVAKSQAELAKMQADPNARPEQIEAARLAVEAFVAAMAGTIAEGEAIQQQRQVMESEATMRRQSQSIQQQSQLRNAELERIQSIKSPHRRKLELKALTGQITPAEMQSLDILRERDSRKREADEANRQFQDRIKGYGFTAEKAVNVARNWQSAIQNTPTPNLPVVNIQGAIEGLQSSLSGNIVGAIGNGNSILTSIASQLSTIIGAIKSQQNQSTKPQTINNVAIGPTPQQIQSIANESSLKTLKGVIRTAST